MRPNLLNKILMCAAIVLLALLASAPKASAIGWHGGFVVVGTPGWYPGGYYYGPYGPWFGPGYYSIALAGKVEIKTHVFGNSIFVDGGYIGKTGELKKFTLKMGLHAFKVKDRDGKIIYQEKLNVLAGKKLRLNIDPTD